MSSDNFDLYTSYYDLLYADKKYSKEADFISELLAQYGPNGKQILELGCGTGIHAGYLAQKGYKIHGIDQSDTMLELAKKRASENDAEIANRLSFDQGDLRDFKVADKYDSVISLFDVVSYLPDNTALKQSLTTIKNCLRPDGLFVFDVWYGPAVYTQKPHTRVRRLENEQAQIVRIAEPEFHYQRNVIDVNYNIFVKNKQNGELSNFKETHPMRCFFDAELDEIMGQFSFERVFAMEWFSKNKPSTDSWSVLFGYRLAGA